MEKAIDNIIAYTMYVLFFIVFFLPIVVFFVGRKVEKWYEKRGETFLQIDMGVTKDMLAFLSLPVWWGTISIFFFNVVW